MAQPDRVLGSRMNGVRDSNFGMMVSISLKNNNGNADIGRKED